MTDTYNSKFVRPVILLPWVPYMLISGLFHLSGEILGIALVVSLIVAIPMSFNVKYYKEFPAYYRDLYKVIALMVAVSCLVFWFDKAQGLIMTLVVVPCYLYSLWLLIKGETALKIKEHFNKRI